MTRCSRCGCLYDGEHDCSADMKAAAVLAKHCGVIDSMTDEQMKAVAAMPVPVREVGTYRYRDADKRRTYMRDYMRKRRGRADPV